MTPQEFIKKWRPVALTERQTAQEHFIDLCRLVGHPTPVESDPTSESYCFEKGALKSSGNPGFADVWKKGYFGFEYKKKNLGEALKQLSQYAWNLENPPLNVACDTNAFKIVTAWTNTPSSTVDLSLDDLADPEKFAILHAVFHDPEKLRGHMTRETLTKKAADNFSGLAMRLQSRGHSPEAVAHFVMQLVFCFFAEDVKLLPEGFFRKAIKELAQPRRAQYAKAMLDDMFAAMAHGGRVGNEFLAHFNGGLFDRQQALPLDEGDMNLLVAAGGMGWDEIDPSIFGTLFERFLDPAKRAQIGAHYTDTKKVLQIVDPVVMRPLEAEWAEIKAKIETLIEAASKKNAHSKNWAQAEGLRHAFIERLAGLRILDSACGSGNFLYTALQRVKDLEFRVNNECETLGLKAPTPRVGPEILFGIEINRLAAEIACTTIWIGDIQWGLKHAVYTRPEPVLRKLDQIECRDAVLEPLPDGQYVEAQWPKVEFIVGNPPFLGGKVMRQGRRSKSGETSGLGDDYVDALFAVYKGQVPAEADFVCYWFAKAWKAMQAGDVQRVRLVATNSIRGGANRRVLDSIAAENEIFEAWADEPWIIEGAAVRVSLLCFGPDAHRHLDGHSVQRINADLTGLSGDITQARALFENAAVAFMGDTKGGAFDVPGELARAWLKEPINPNGRPNSDVLKPWVNGLDLTRRPRDMWIIDFGWTIRENEAALFECPFAHILENVKPERDKNRRDTYRLNWWRHVEPRSAPRTAIQGHKRYLVTPRVAKHRLFIWLDGIVVPDSRTFGFIRSDDTFFGILHSRFHETWTLRTCSWHGVGNDPTYNSAGVFETFPFPRRSDAQHSCRRLRRRSARDPHRSGGEAARRIAPQLAEPAGPYPHRA